MQYIPGYLADQMLADEAMKILKVNFGKPLYLEMSKLEITFENRPYDKLYNQLFRFFFTPLKDNEVEVAFTITAKSSDRKELTKKTKSTT
jgi:hypothetical protein